MPDTKGSQLPLLSTLVNTDLIVGISRSGTPTTSVITLANLIASMTGTSAGHLAAGNDSRFSGNLTVANSLSDLGSVSAARTNLGLGTAATVAIGSLLQTANNLSDLANPATARTNLGLGGAALLSVGTTTGTVARGDDSRITGAMQAANNLSDISNAVTARTNLGLGTVATHASTEYVTVVNNLSDLSNAATARTNLGLGSAATQNSTTFAARASNLSDLVSASAARTNLGLGGAATLSIGTTAGTVAAGDDSRFLSGGGGAVIGTTAGTVAAGDDPRFDEAARTADLGTAAFFDIGMVTGTVAAGDDPRILSAAQINRVTFSNENWTVAYDTRYLAQIGSLTTSRTVILPPANTVTAGATITVADESGTVTLANTIIVNASGGDTLNGAVSTIISTANGVRTFISNGTNLWTFAASSTSGTVTTSLNVESMFNPSNPTYGAVGNGADDAAKVAQCFNDAILANGTVYLPILYYMSTGITIPASLSGFKLPSVTTVDTTTNIITFDLNHGKLPGDTIMFQGVAPAGALTGIVYFGNYGTTNSTALYTDRTLAIAGGTTGRVNITGGLTTTGTISTGSKFLSVSAELGAGIGSKVTINGVGNSTGGFYVEGGIGTGILLLNAAANATASGTNNVTFTCWIDWRFFDGGLKVVTAPGGGMKKHQRFNTANTSALINVAIGGNVDIRGATFEGLSNMLVPWGTTGTIAASTNTLTVSNATWARPGMAITIGDYGVTSRIRSIAGNVITLMANVPGTATYSSGSPAIIRGQITSGVIGLTVVSGGGVGTNTVTMNSVDGICAKLNLVFDTSPTQTTYTVGAVDVVNKTLTFTTNGLPNGPAQNITQSIPAGTLMYLSGDAGDDGIRVGSIHQANIQHCIFRHFGDAAFRAQTNTGDYSATSAANPFGGVNTGSILFKHNYLYNCYQTSTTTNDYAHGGAETVWFEGNTFDMLVGSVKFANRVPGGRDLWIINNKIKSSYNHGFEIDSNSDVKIYGNSLQNIYNQGIFFIANNGPTNVSVTATTSIGNPTVTVSSSAIFANGATGNIGSVGGAGGQPYTVLSVVDSTHITVSPTPTANLTNAPMSLVGTGIVGFPFDGLDIDHNIFDNVGLGSGVSCIRIGPDTYGDNSLWSFPGVKITNNTFKNINNTSSVPINIVNGSLTGLRIEGNDFPNCKAVTLVKMTLRSSSTAGFINGFRVSNNNFNMNNPLSTAVWIQGTSGGSIPQLNEIDIDSNVFSGVCTRAILLDNCSNVRITRNRANLQSTAGAGGNFYFTNNNIITNLRIEGNDIETDNTFGYACSGINGLYIINNRHKINAGSNASTVSIANSCSSVYYINNVDINANSLFTGSANFNQVPVSTKSMNSLLRHDEGTLVPSAGTWQQGSTLSLNTATAGGTRWYCTVSGTFGTPALIGTPTPTAPTAITDGTTNNITFSTGGLADFPVGSWINIAGAWTGARQIISTNPAAGTAIVSGAVPASVPATVIAYSPPTFVLSNPILGGRSVFPSNANYNCLRTDTYVAQTSVLTAARLATLPLANTVPAGQAIRIQDESGSVTNANAMQVSRQGSDLINGSSAIRNIQVAFGGETYYSDGVSNWVTTPNVVVNSVTFSDIDYTILTSDRQVLQNGALTATRTVTLPAASSLQRGTQITISDDSGTCNATNNIIIARQGSDGIHGLASIYISTAWGSRTLESNGANKWTIVARTEYGTKTITGATYTATLSDEVILVDATAAAVSIVLPTSVNRNGKSFAIKKIDASANVVNVNTTASQTIDGVTTKQLTTQYQSIKVNSDNANWWII